MLCIPFFEAFCYEVKETLVFVLGTQVHLANGENARVDFPFVQAPHEQGGNLPKRDLSEREVNRKAHFYSTSSSSSLAELSLCAGDGFSAAAAGTAPCLGSDL